MLAAFFAAVLACAMTDRAAAVGCPSLNDGGQRFSQINGPQDPEDFCFEVQLGEEQEMRQIDDRHVGVFYNTGQQSFVITAEEAADVEGASVPTTLALTGMDEITLTVHHREGNPRAGGAPFHYPITAGSGWEGGFQTTTVNMPPPTEQKTNPPISSPVPTCEVPFLQGRTLRAAKRALRRAGCALGPVRSYGAKVVKQYRPTGKVLPAGTEVGVKLGR